MSSTTSTTTASTTTTITTTTSTSTTAPLPHRLEVDEQEWSVYPAHNPVGAGTVTFNVDNFGQDQHDLAVERNGVILAETPLVDPGSTSTLSVQLPPGTYTLFCTLYDHQSLGMHATLVVK